MFVSKKSLFCSILLFVSLEQYVGTNAVRYGLHKQTTPPPILNQTSRVGSRSEQFNNAMNAYNIMQDQINNRIDSDNTVNTVLLISNQKELPVYYEIVKPTLEIAALAARKVRIFQFFKILDFFSILNFFDSSRSFIHI